MPPFRSPLSRMLLSPRIQLPRALLRSLVAIQNTSPSAAICRGQTSTHTIDLNVQPEGYVQESDENVQPQRYDQESYENMQPEGYAENDKNIQPEGGQRSQKRKSPCVTMPPFRSPLSRMLLSLRIQLPRALLRSPVTIQNTSPSAVICRGQTTTHTIDLNVHPERCVQESDENVQPQGYAENDENIQEGYSQEGDENLLPQENARKNLTLSDEKRRAIFESLLARANNGEITGHEKKEVSEEFSVPIRTVQRIWKKGKSYLEQGHLVDVSSARSKCGRKKMQLDVSTLRDLPQASRTTIADVARTCSCC